MGSEKEQHDEMHIPRDLRFVAEDYGLNMRLNAGERDFKREFMKVVNEVSDFRSNPQLQKFKATEIEIHDATFVSYMRERHSRFARSRAATTQCWADEWKMSWNNNKPLPGAIRDEDFFTKSMRQRLIKYVIDEALDSAALPSIPSLRKMGVLVNFFPLHDDTPQQVLRPSGASLVFDAADETRNRVFFQVQNGSRMVASTAKGPWYDVMRESGTRPEAPSVIGGRLAVVSFKVKSTLMGEVQVDGTDWAFTNPGLLELQDGWPGARDRLDKTWVRASCCSEQPLDLVRNYFGEKVAMYFAFLGLYTYYLLFPACIGIIYYVLTKTGTPITYYANQTDSSGTVTLKTYTLARPGGMGGYTFTGLYCAFLAVWSTVFLEMLKRQNVKLAFTWGSSGAEADEKDRADFVGSAIERDPVTNKDFQVYPIWRRQLFQIFVSAPVIASACICVMAIAVSLILYRTAFDQLVKVEVAGASLGGLLVSFFCAASIIVCDAVYNKIGMALLEAENHRTQTEYDDARVQKVFLFRFINAFVSLAYVAFAKPFGVQIFGLEPQYCLHSDSNTPTEQNADNCFAELEMQSAAIMILKTTQGQIMEVVKPAIKGMINRCFQLRQQAALAKKRQEDDEDIVSSVDEEGKLGNSPSDAPQADADALSQPLLGLSEVAEQFALPDNEDTGNFEDYCEMALQYGYVTLFAAAWPVASTVALFNNVIEIRTDAWKFLHGQKMPWYMTAEDIGLWRGVLEGMSFWCVVTNLVLICFVSPLFATYDYSTRIILVVVCEHAVILAKLMFGYIIPDKPEDVKQAEKRDAVTIEELADSEDPHPWDAFQENAEPHRQMKFRMAQADPNRHYGIQALPRI